MSGPHRSVRAKRATSKPYSRPESRKPSFFTQAVSFLWPSTSPQPPDPVEGEESEEDEDALMPPVDRPPSLPPPTTPVQLGPTFSRPPPPGSASSTQGIYAPLTPETHTMQDDVLEHIETLSDLRLYVQARPHLNPLEKEGVVAIMARLEIKEQQQQNQFRFASVSRDASPARQSPSSSSPASSLGGLSKNPNGILRYGGVGSSRVRNKYRGAGFASASPRRSPSINISADSSSSASGAKRRKTDYFSTSASSSASTSASNNSDSLNAGPGGGFSFRPQGIAPSTSQKSYSTPPPPDREGAPAPSPNRVKEARGQPLPPSSSQPHTFSWGEPSKARLARSPSPAKQFATAPLFAIGTGGLPKTQPKQPSPLRQTFVVRGSPSSSEGGDSPSRGRKANGSATSETAKFMQSLISSLDDDKGKGRQEIRNPYQDALPAHGKRKRSRVPVPIPKRSKKDKAKAGEEQQEEVGVVKTRSNGGISTQKLVEASIPKGSKRAKPPASTSAEEGLNRRRSPRLSPTPSTIPLPSTSFSALGTPEESGSSPKKGRKVEIVEVSDEEDGGSPPKKHKVSSEEKAPKSNGIGLGKPSAFSAPSQSPSAFSASSSIASAGSSAFGSPSIFGKDAAPATTSIFGGGLEPSSSSSIFGNNASATSGIFGKDASSSSSSLFGDSLAETTTEKQQSLFAPTSSSASTTDFTSPILSSSRNEQSSTIASSSTSAASIKSQPSFSPDAELSPPPGGFSFTTEADKLARVPKVGSKLRHSFAREENAEHVATLAPTGRTDTAEDVKARTLALPVHTLPSFAFPSVKPVLVDGLSKEAKAARETALAMPASDITQSYKWDWSKTTSPPSKPVSKAFNWSAAGISVPTATEGEWKCGTCMISNPVSKSKCLSCESDKPSSIAASTSTSGGDSFNWAAAGINLPQKKEGDWNCGTCMVSNPGVGTKCLACESDRPSSGGGTPAPAAAKFNWAAAGVAPQNSEGEWACGTCMVRNPANKDKCVSCESDKP